MNNCTFFFGDSCEQLSSVKAQITFLISTETKEIIEIYLHIFTFFVTSLIGVVVNSINVGAFWRHGLKDSITVGFFALSASDLVVVATPLLTASCYAARLLLPAAQFDFPSIHYVSSAWLRNMFYSLSSCLTAFLSVERCCCVVLPFKVKLIFSLRRSVVIISLIFIFHVACFLPIFATHRLRWSPLPGPNGTARHILRVAFLPHRKVIEGFNSTLMGIVLPTVSQFVVTVCVVILINGLRKSSRFRNAIAASQSHPQSQLQPKPQRNHQPQTQPQNHPQSQPQPQTQPQTQPQNYPPIAPSLAKTNSDANDNGITSTGKTNNSNIASIEMTSSNNGSSNNSSSNNSSHNNSSSNNSSSNGNSNNKDDDHDRGGDDLSTRDVRLVKTMIFLVIILSACNVPFLMMNYARRLVPDLNIRGAFQNTFSVSYAVVYILGTVNAVANFFVYYNTSTRFRETVREMFRCQRKK